MTTKVNKLVKLAAVGLFLIALAINVKVTLDDPFTVISEEAAAQVTTDSNTTSSGFNSCNVGDKACRLEPQPNSGMN